MKNAINLTLIIILTILISNEIKAQPSQYAPAVTLENPAFSTSTSVYNTGNDYRYSHYNGTQTLKVWVADGNSNFLYWEPDNNSSLAGDNGLDNLNYDAVDPDVVLVEDTTHYIWWAIVVYNVSNVGNFCEFFRWNGSFFSQAYAYPIQLDNSANVKAINIDADANGNYVIVWDDGAGSIFYSSGGTTSSGPDMPSTPIRIYHVNGNLSYLEPDVSIYNNGTNSYVYVTYLTNDGTDNNILVDKYDLSMTYLGNMGPVAPWSYRPLTLGKYDYPRIACPNATNCATPDFTVVYEYHDVVNNYDKILGATYSGYHSYIYKYNYTYLSAWSLDISTVGNAKPVVTYSSDFSGDGSSGGIIVGWTSVNPPSGGDPGVETYAVKCDETGAMSTSTATCNYMMVPAYPNTNSSDVQNFLSLSGRDNYTDDHILYTWFNNNVSNSGDAYVMYKDVSFSSPNLRLENTNGSVSLFISGIYPNPTTGDFKINVESEAKETVTIEIYNSFGQVIYCYNDFSESASYTKEVSLKDYKDGIYLVRVSNGLLTNNWKIILTN